jgi:hypothetical protein
VVARDRTVVDRYGRFLDPILSRISAQNPAIADQVEQFRETVQSSFAAACR